VNKQEILYTATTTSPFFDIHDAVVGLIKPAQVNGSVEDGPDLFGELFEGDEVVLEQAADEDLPVLPAERGVARDAADLEMSGVLNGPGPVGEGPWRCGIENGGGLHVQGFVGALVVIDSTELVEA
jgi:hypothetical protein